MIIKNKLMQNNKKRSRAEFEASNMQVNLQSQGYIQEVPNPFEIAKNDHQN